MDSENFSETGGKSETEGENASLPQGEWTPLATGKYFNN